MMSKGADITYHQMVKNMTKGSFAILCEEQKSPNESSEHIKPLPKFDTESIVNSCMEGIASARLNIDVVERIVKKTEEVLVADFQRILQKEIDDLNFRFEEVLQNEEIRTSYMMCEAHRERQEKILALQTQLECKNLAGLMYVLCQERKKSKMEKSRLKEEYTKYIEALRDILKESQEIILNLSRGYKTAARVDHEWKEKMKKVIKEFQNFVFSYMGGRPEVNQYFFDIPKMLKIKAPIEDNPSEDPCEPERSPSQETEDTNVKEWYETMDDEDRPFIVFGDLSPLEYVHRKIVSNKAKAQKTAPECWKSYIFNGRSLQDECDNVSVIKDHYMGRIPLEKWECHLQQALGEDHSVPGRQTSQLDARRGTLRQSADFRGNMGSILKLITATASLGPPAKTILLGARDSMEITSTTKMREKRRQSIIDNGVKSLHHNTEDIVAPPPEEYVHDDHLKLERSYKDDRRESVHTDSMQIIKSHKPDVDHKINYEKVCPVEECRRRQVDSFTRQLPSYMRANPFELFDVSYVKYEPCTSEQLQVLRERIERKKAVLEESPASPINEWTAKGLSVQTQTQDETEPCMCQDDDDEEISQNIVYNIEDLIPMKHVLDEIQQTCFFDPRVQFNRFKVVGQDSEADSEPVEEGQKYFHAARLDKITEILKAHPSLCTLFQGNTRC